MFRKIYSFMVRVKLTSVPKSTLFGKLLWKHTILIWPIWCRPISDHFL